MNSDEMGRYKNIQEAESQAVLCIAPGVSQKIPWNHGEETCALVAKQVSREPERDVRIVGIFHR